MRRTLLSVEIALLALAMGAWWARKLLACAFAGHPYPVKRLVADTWAWACPRCGRVGDLDSFIPIESL